MIRDIFNSVKNTTLGVGTIFIIQKEDLTFFLSILIAILTVVYLFFQIRKCIKDTTLRDMEISNFKNHKKNDKN
jgi:hypothetical protein